MNAATMFFWHVMKYRQAEKAVEDAINKKDKSEYVKAVEMRDKEKAYIDDQISKFGDICTKRFLEYKMQNIDGKKQ